MSNGWFTLPDSAADVGGITPDAAVRAAQRALSVSADGVVGRETMLALSRFVSSTFNSLGGSDGSAPPARLEELREVGRLIGTVRPGQPLPPAVWNFMAKIGLNVLIPSAVSGTPVITGGSPVYRGAALNSPQTPTTTTPRSSTPARANPGQQGGVSPSDASTSLATRVGAFYDKNRTAMNIAAGVLIVGAGAAVYFAMKDDDSGGGGGDAVSRREAEEAARRLQVSIDSDKQSIRAGAARAMAAYSAPSDASRRAVISSARDTLLRWNSQRMGSPSGAPRRLPRGR